MERVNVCDSSEGPVRLRGRHRYQVLEDPTSKLPQFPLGFAIKKTLPSPEISSPQPIGAMLEALSSLLAFCLPGSHIPEYFANLLCCTAPKSTHARAAPNFYSHQQDGCPSSAIVPCFVHWSRRCPLSSNHGFGSLAAGAALAVLSHLHTQVGVGRVQPAGLFFLLFLGVLPEGGDGPCLLLEDKGGDGGRDLHLTLVLRLLLDKWVTISIASPVALGGRKKKLHIAAPTNSLPAFRTSAWDPGLANSSIWNGAQNPEVPRFVNILRFGFYTYTPVCLYARATFPKT